MLKMVCFVIFINNILYHPVIYTSHYHLIRPMGWLGDWRGGGGGVGHQANWRWGGGVHLWQQFDLYAPIGYGDQ